MRLRRPKNPPRRVNPELWAPASGMLLARPRHVDGYLHSLPVRSSFAALLTQTHHLPIAAASRRSQQAVSPSLYLFSSIASSFFDGRAERTNLSLTHVFFRSDSRPDISCLKLNPAAPLAAQFSAWSALSFRPRFARNSFSCAPAP